MERPDPHPRAREGGTGARPYHHRIRRDARLFDPDPATRLRAAREQGPLATRRLRRAARDWPPLSPGALNAWLALVTTKPPSWRDPLLEWRERPPSLGEPHEGFLYPDPLGFWAEMRRWATTLLRMVEPGWGGSEALSLTAAVHQGDEPERLRYVTERARPRLVLFLDEPAWTASAPPLVRRRAHHVPDPHREGQAYEGVWGTTADGVVVGKSPQHPAAHRLYDARHMSDFLLCAPVTSPE